MQRINQRRVLSSQKDDKELKSSSMVNSRISNMAKELENVLRNRPNTNNSRTENVVMVKVSCQVSCCLQDFMFLSFCFCHSACC